MGIFQKAGFSLVKKAKISLSKLVIVFVVIRLLGFGERNFLEGCLES